MKRLALLSVVALLLASTVFAPAAAAQQPGEVVVQQVTLGPGGSVTLTGTIQCTEGYFYYVSVQVSQRSSGNLYNTAYDSVGGQCTTTGATPFTLTMLGEGPFHRGPAVVSTYSELCDPDFINCTIHRGLEAVHIR